MNVGGIPFQHGAGFWIVTAFCVMIAAIGGGWFANQHWFRR
jgi:Mg2+ and Co2+ transporter CorA